LGVVALLALFTPAQSVADGPLEPSPPDYMVETMNGLPFALGLPELPAETDEVRFEVDGNVVQVNSFEPFEDPISTRRLTRQGVSLDTVHSLTVSAVSFFEAAVVLGHYKLLIHALPVIQPVNVYPLVIRKRTTLVGFQLHGIGKSARVKAWGHGFRHTPANRPLPLRLIKRGKSSRTYRAPDGLEWRHGSRPRLIFSISPPLSRTKHGYPIRGRIFTGVLKTDDRGDTAIRHTDDWNRCSEELSRGKRPPRRVSCVYF